MKKPDYKFKMTLIITRLVYLSSLVASICIGAKFGNSVLDYAQKVSNYNRFTDYCKLMFLCVIIAICIGFIFATFLVNLLETKKNKNV